MEPETPSRRKKAGDEPVTIDLEAVPASVSNETLAAEEAAKAETPENQAAEAADTATTETAACAASLSSSKTSCSAVPLVKSSAALPLFAAVLLVQLVLLVFAREKQLRRILAFAGTLVVMLGLSAWAYLPVLTAGM